MPVPGAVKRLALRRLAVESSEHLPDSATKAGECDAGRRGPTAHWGIVPLLGPLDLVLCRAASFAKAGPAPQSGVHVVDVHLVECTTALIALTSSGSGDRAIDRAGVLCGLVFDALVTAAWTGGQPRQRSDRCLRRWSQFIKADARMGYRLSEWCQANAAPRPQTMDVVARNFPQ